MAMIPDPTRCEDEGLFGPDAIVRRVLGPTYSQALIYAGFMFILNPWDATISYDNTTITSDPRKRAVETLEYTFAVVFGDRATAKHATELVNSIHDTVTGQWGPTGDRIHSASEPENLLWFLTVWGQGLLEAYQAYGPKKLTAAERDQFWRDEVSIIAGLNRIPPEMRFQSQAEVDAYILEQSANLHMTAVVAQVAAFMRKPAVRMAASSGLVLLPEYALHLLGVRPFSRIERLAIVAAHRPVLTALTLTPVVRDLAMGAVISRPAMELMWRARQAARTGQYDAPSGGEKLRLATSA